jgi:hypothetical protein
MQKDPRDTSNCPSRDTVMVQEITISYRIWEIDDRCSAGPALLRVQEYVHECELIKISNPGLEARTGQQKSAQNLTRT